MISPCALVLVLAPKTRPLEGNSRGKSPQILRFFIVLWAVNGIVRCVEIFFDDLSYFSDKMAEKNEVKKGIGDVRHRISPASTTTTPSSGNPSFQCNQSPQNHLENEFSEQCKSMAEYYERLRRWVFMYQSHVYMQQHMMLMMPYVTLASYLQQQQATVTGTTSSQTSGGVMNGQPVTTSAAPQQQFGLGAQNQRIQNEIRLAHGVQNQQNVSQNANNIPQIAVLEFSVPSVWRRVIAELIDFFLLFSAKLGLMLIIIDYLGISSDTTGFMMRFLVEEIEDDTSLEELQQMLLFAFIYRIIVCIYETFFLCSTVNRVLGGATPGKFLMRLRVISLEQVQSAGPGRVQVTLPDSVGFTQALLRSVVKNFSMAFFFPACITVFFNPHFRAAYEVLTRTMVVGTENWPLTFQRRGQNQQVIR